MIVKFGKMNLINIGPFKEVEYDFNNKLKTNVIIGTNTREGFQENGVGKSFIPDALLWIPYGISRTTDKKSILNINETSCSGTLELSDNKYDYLITRSITNNTLTKLSLVRIDINGNKKILGRKITDVQNIINSLFGTYSAMSSVIYLTQENIVNFLYGTSGERINILVSYFPILLIWDKAIIKCKMLIKEKLIEVSNKDYETKYLLDSINEVDYDKISNEKSKLHEICDNIKKEIIVNKKEYDKIKCNINLVNEIEKLIQLLKNNKHIVNAEIESLRNSLSIIDSKNVIKKKIGIFKKEWRRNVKIASNLKTYQNIVEELTLKYDAMNSKLQTADKGIFSCKEKIEELKLSLEQLKKDMICPFCFQEVNDKCYNIIYKKIKTYSSREMAFSTISETCLLILEKLNVKIKKYKLKINDCENSKRLVDEIDNSINDSYSKLEKIINVEEKIELKKQMFINFRKDSKCKIGKLKKQLGDYDNNDNSEVGNKISELKIELVKNKLKIKDYKNTLRKYRSIKRKLEFTNKEIEKIQFKIDVYEYLKIIFFKSKINVINNISIMLERNMNIYINQLEFVNSEVRFSSSIIGSNKDKYEIYLSNENDKWREIRTFSFGERKRYNIAMILAIQKTLDDFSSSKYDTLIVDEILTNLDEIGKIMVMKLISSINKNKHMILLQNDLNYVDIDYNLVKIKMNKNGRSKIEEFCHS